MGCADGLIGRARELGLLEGLIRGVRGGAAATVLVEGEAGIGKTRLLRRAIGVARERGVAVFHGEAHLLDRTRPFGALVDAFELRRGSNDPRRAAVGRLMAGGVTVGTESPPAGALQFQVVEAIIDLVEVLSDQGPVLVALEDLHWADSSTLLTLRWITRELTQVPLLLVATLRPAPRSPELGQFLEDCVESGATVIRLKAFGSAEVAALVRAELGRSAGASLIELVARAGGNPLWVVELVRSMIAEGTIDLTGTTAEASGTELPDSLRQLVLRRLGYLPETTAAALRSASLLGDAFSLVDLAAVTDRRAGELLEKLRPAFTSGLLADQETALVFNHQLVREAIYEDIPAAARVALHREAGRALAAAGAPLSQVASHVLLGAIAGDAEAALSLRRAAREAAPRAPAIAVDLLSRAHELLPSGHSERDGILRELAVALLRTGEVSRAALIAEEVLGRPHDAGVEMPLRIALIDALSILNRGQDLIEQTEAALNERPDLSIGDRALIVAQGSFGRTFSGDFVGGEVVARRALGLAEQGRDTAMTVWSLTTLAVAVKTQGRYQEALALTRRAVQLAFESPDDDARMRHPNFIHGMVLCDCDLMDDAALAFAKAAEECSELESAWIVPDIQLVVAELRFLLGDWVEAEPRFAGGVLDARERGNLILMPRIHGYLALIAAARGDLRAAELALAPVAAELTSEHPHFGAEFVAHAASVMAEVDARARDAFELLRRFWRYDIARENRYSHRYLAPPLVRLALVHGEPALAREVTEGAEQSAALAGEIPSVHSAALRCRGLIERDPEAMVRSVELARRGRRVLDLAGTCEDAATVLGSHGRTADARVLLAEALDHYEALGASWLQARANAALRTHGARRGRRGSRERAQSGWGSLTQSERAVADLVAEGLTNREVGQRLFISPHTVNTHLRHTFQKLEVTTRAALATKISSIQDHAIE